MSDYLQNIHKSLSLIILVVALNSCSDTKYAQGARIYQSLCSNCHMEDGSGLGKLIPALNEGNFAKSPQMTTCKIIRGYNAEEFGNSMKVMPSFKNLSEVEMSNLLNYLNEIWGNTDNHYNITEVTKWMEECKTN